VFLNVVPVIVSCGDPGSCHSFDERKLMDALRSPKSVTIHTMALPRTLDGEAVSVLVEPLESGVEHSGVVVVDEIPLNRISCRNLVTWMFLK